MSSTIKRRYLAKFNDTLAFCKELIMIKLLEYGQVDLLLWKNSDNDQFLMNKWLYNTVFDYIKYFKKWFAENGLKLNKNTRIITKVSYNKEINIKVIKESLIKIITFQINNYRFGDNDQGLGTIYSYEIPKTSKFYEIINKNETKFKTWCEKELLWFESKEESIRFTLNCEYKYMNDIMQEYYSL
jgi:hypothetical protein